MTNVMKKLFSMLFIAAMCCMALVSCGNDDELVKPEPTHNLESVYESVTDVHYMFDIDLKKDSSSIYLYNIVFRIGETTSPAMSIRIDAPVTVDKTGKIYTYAGTGIMPYMMRGNTLVPMTGDAYLVTNLLCNVNTEAKTYDIKFDCHGGHFEDAGRLK